MIGAESKVSSRGAELWPNCGQRPKWEGLAGQRPKWEGLAGYRLEGYNVAMTVAVRGEYGGMG